MEILETERLVLRWLTTEDAEFMLRLVNEPAWLRFIGDRGVRTLEDSRKFLEAGPLAMYRQHGFGLYRVELRGSGTPVGICGLLKRESLEDVDLGFALLSEFQSQGFAFESAAAVMAYGRDTLGLSRLVAITSPENHVSGKLLEKLGFHFERMARLAPDGPEVRLYATGTAANV